MKRQFRILKHQEFDRIIQAGKSVKSAHYSIFFQPSEGKTRIGIAVSKKNGGAVARVKMKRQIRAMIAENCDLSRPIDLIIVVRPSYKTEDYVNEKEELYRCLTNIKETQN